MAELIWATDDVSWATLISNDVFDDLEIRVVTGGETNPPTERQLQAVAEIEALTKQDLVRIAELARKYAKDNLEPEDLEEMEDEDYEVEIYSATIPRLRDATDTFVLFAANSEIDMEHGVACVCKNGKQFAVVDADCVYQNYDWDSVDELNALL
jgi:hypothetical protein